MKKVALVVAACSATFLAACELLPALIGAMLLVLGIAPAQGFSDPDSPEYGRVALAVTGETDDGVPAVVDGDDIEVETEDGEPCDVEDVEETKGHSKGSFVMLVDDSGSTELATASDCEGCPTDPTRMRVEAVKGRAAEVGRQAPDWRLAIMDFGTDAPTDGFAVTRLVSDFTMETEATVSKADQLVSVAGTPLYDSVYEVLSTVKADVSQNFHTDADPDVGWGMVVLSDGQDTESSKSLAEVIARAQELGVAVHVVGLGQAADKGDGRFSTVHVEQLRKLAVETGGFYGSVESPDELPALYEKIAKSLVGGFQQVEVTVKNPPPSGSPVTGRIGLKGTGIKVPFRFTAP